MKKALNGRLNLSAGDMDYVRFGSGKTILVMLPGLGDGIKTVKGMALLFAAMYRSIRKDFTTYIFSRRKNIEYGTTHKDYSDDLNEAFEELDIKDAYLMGVSQGGMIAQRFALDHKDKLKGLILVVTSCRMNETINSTIGSWIKMAKDDDYQGIMLDLARLSYSENVTKKQIKLVKHLGNIGKPKSFDRFIIQAEAIFKHDTYDELKYIKCPTLILGGKEDKIVTPDASIEMANLIPNNKLVMYDGLGHALYEETPDFIKQLKIFCK